MQAGVQVALAWRSTAPVAHDHRAVSLLCGETAETCIRCSLHENNGNGQPLGTRLETCNRLQPQSGQQSTPEELNHESLGNKTHSARMRESGHGVGWHSARAQKEILYCTVRNTILLPVQKRRTTRTLYLTSANNPDSQNCLRRCMKVAHMAKLSPIRLLQLSVKRLAQCELARSIGSSTPT